LLLEADFFAKVSRFRAPLAVAETLAALQDPQTLPE